MAKIVHIYAEEILDSRGNPTVRAKVVLEDGSIGEAGVPSGASTGSFEAVELRDQDPHRFGGLGVLKAVDNVNQKIAPALLGFEASNQEKLDSLMRDLDGTPNKSKLGANAILGVSLSVAIAQAHSQKTPLYKYLNNLVALSLPTTDLDLPTPMFNLINGGRHGNGNLDIQEFLVIPEGSLKYQNALENGVMVYKKLKTILISRGESISTGDEGGYTPALSNKEALERLEEAIRAVRELLAGTVNLGLDIAASGLLRGSKYFIKEFPQGLTTAEFSDYLLHLKDSFHLISIEDPLDEEDWQGWTAITQKAKPTLIVADDLVSTNPERLAKCVEQKAASGLIVKLNQIGTLTEALEVAVRAKKDGLKIVVSHRSGEVDDFYLADLAVALSAEFIKAGAPFRGERVAKYNRLLEIERDLENG